MKENSKIYRCYQGYGDNMAIKDIIVPEGVVFYVNRHDRDDSSLDKDRYDLLAVIPYSEEKKDIISSNSLITDAYKNIFDKYIIWQIRDIIPIDSDFPITLVAPVIDEIYFKMTKVNDSKASEVMRKEGIIDHFFDSEYMNDIQNIIIDNTDTIYYAKIHGISERGYLDITYIQVKNSWNHEDEARIDRQNVELRNIFDNTSLQSNYSLVDEQEFDYALNEALLSLGVMF